MPAPVKLKPNNFRLNFYGELSLDSNLQPIKGTLPIAIKASKEGFKGILLPKQNIREATVVDNLKVYGEENILELINFFDKEETLESFITHTRKGFYNKLHNPEHDFADVKDQDVINVWKNAAAGGHQVIFVGPSGAGKRILAKRWHRILPPMTLKEILEMTKNHSVVGRIRDFVELISERSFRSPLS